MRHLAFTWPVVSMIACTGCSVNTESDSISVQPQTKFVAQVPVVRTAGKPWTGQAIVIENVNGRVEVRGEPGRTTIEVSARPFAYAAGEKPGDAETAKAEVADSVRIVEADQFAVTCAQAVEAHGTASAKTTGCEDFIVFVPAGSTALGLKLRATAHNGDLTASNLTSNVVPARGISAATCEPIELHSDRGAITAASMVGGVVAVTPFGGVHVSVAPSVACLVDAATTDGNATVALPADFAADAVQVAGAHVVTSDFPDLQNNGPRGAPGTGASKVKVSAPNGTATLKKQ